MRKIWLTLLCVLSVASAIADFSPVPKSVVKALKITRGKSFDSGIVFVEGKYLPPPYQVERYGNVIRINGEQVTGPIVPWSDFIKTQDGVKVTKSVTEPTAVAEPEPEPEPEPEIEEEDEDEDPLADLFDDDDDSSSSKKKKPASKPKKRKPRPPKPQVTVNYELEGEFVLNSRAKALVARINAQRTSIDANLRKGGFFFAGSAYPTGVKGGLASAREVMAKLPGLQKNYSEEEDFITAARAAGLTYFPEQLLRDLFRNRIDYITLERRRDQIEEELKQNAVPTVNKDSIF